MKKVYIITVQKAPNFGAYLQAYALYRYIADLGHDCSIIDLLRPVHKDFVHTKGYDPYLKLNFKQKLRRKYKKIQQAFLKCVCYSQFKEMQIAKFRFQEFDRLIKYTRTYKSIKDLYDNPPIGDIFITGSDQLWNPTQYYCLEPYFLTFVKGKAKKISYATSIGISELPLNVIKDFKKWLSSYDFISVREIEAKRILIQGGIKDDIEKVCDPTFLLSSSKWKSLAVQPKEGKKYIFLFTLYGD